MNCLTDHDTIVEIKEDGFFSRIYCNTCDREIVIEAQDGYVEWDEEG